MYLEFLEQYFTNLLGYRTLLRLPKHQNPGHRRSLLSWSLLLSDDRRNSNHDSHCLRLNFSLQVLRFDKVVQYQQLIRHLNTEQHLLQTNTLSEYSELLLSLLALLDSQNLIIQYFLNHPQRQLYACQVNRNVDLNRPCYHSLGLTILLHSKQ